jgi:mono/diheme cytochrome c family protein
VNQIIARFVLPGAALLCALGAQTRPESPKGKGFDSVEGQALYGTYCAVCHGDNGKGGGPMAKVLKTPPPDLTHIWTRHGGRFSLEQVQKIISGEAGVGAHGTSEMPLWGPIFSQGVWDQDLGRVRIYNLAKYLEKIQAN